MLIALNFISYNLQSFLRLITLSVRFGKTLNNLRGTLHLFLYRNMLKEYMGISFFSLNIVDVVQLCGTVILQTFIGGKKQI